MAKGLRKRINNKHKSGKLPPFVPLTWEMLNSVAYKLLKKSASKALPFLIGKPKITITHGEFYKKDFEFTYREANKLLGYSTRTWSKCIDDLIEKGFIDPVYKGGLKSDGKASNKFRNSIRWLDYGKQEFKSIRWQQFV